MTFLSIYREKLSLQDDLMTRKQVTLHYGYLAIDRSRSNLFHSRDKLPILWLLYLRGGGGGSRFYVNCIPAIWIMIAFGWDW